MEEDVVHWWHGMEDEDNLVTGVDKKSENPERGKSEKKKMFSSLAPRLGRCFNCGESGHWARDCEFEDLKNKCYHCRERGHIRRNCPKLYSKVDVEQIEEMEIDFIPVVKIEHDGASNGLDINCPCAEFETPLVSLSSGAAKMISLTIGLKRKIDLFNEERDSLLRNKKRRFERLEYDGKVLLSLGSEVFKEAMTQPKKEAKRGGLYIDQGEGQEAQSITHPANEEAQDGSIWNNNGKDSFQKRNVACYENGHVLDLLRWHSLLVLEDVISPVGYPDESTPNIDYGLELPREVLKINACFNVDVNGVHYALVEDNHKMFSMDNSLPQCHHSQQLFLSTGSPFSTAYAIDDCYKSKLTPPYCSPTTKGRIWDASQSNAGNISQRNSLFPMRLVPQHVIAQSNSEGRHIDSSRVPSIGHHSTDVGYSLQEVNDREQSPLTAICPLPTTDSSHSLTVEFLRNLLRSKLDRKGDNIVGNDRIALKAVVSLNEKTTPDDNLSIEDFCQ